MNSSPRDPSVVIIHEIDVPNVNYTLRAKTVRSEKWRFDPQGVYCFSRVSDFLRGNREDVYVVGRKGNNCDGRRRDAEVLMQSCGTMMPDACTGEEVGGSLKTKEWSQGAGGLESVPNKQKSGVTVHRKR